MDILTLPDYSGFRKRQMLQRLSAGPFRFSWAGPDGYTSDEQNPEYARKIFPPFSPEKT